MKRKFKILILTISVIAMLFAFALTSSASQSVNEDEIFISVGNLGGEDFSESNLNTSPLVLSYDNFRIFLFTNLFSNSVDYYGFYLIGVESFYNEISTNVESPNIEGNIYNYLKNTYDKCDSSLYYYGHLLYEEAYHYLNSVTQDDLQNKYNEGKLAGVEEFKVSEEYLNTLNFAKTSGVEEFKNSTEYNEILLSKYNEGHSVGTSAGMTAYKSSSEYKNALSEKYNEGYDVGFSDGEKSFDLAPMIVGILVLASMAICLIVYNQKRRKKYRR